MERDVKEQNEDEELEGDDDEVGGTLFALFPKLGEPIKVFIS